MLEFEVELPLLLDGVVEDEDEDEEPAAVSLALPLSERVGVVE